MTEPATKVDLTREIPTYTARRGRFDLVEVPPVQYLMIDGGGDPNTAVEYRDALQTLYPIAYALKFSSKRELGRDFKVMPLEGLWWADDMESFTKRRDKRQWRWTLLIATPDWITVQRFEEAKDAATRKGPPPRLDELRLERLAEGLCAQTLHIGSYDDEAPVLEHLHEEFIPAQGLRMTGRHHEIYLSDPRRTAPERLRTILRQPVTRLAENA